MSVLEKLASVLGRKDEAPNQELAADIAAQKDQRAVKELVEQLSHKSKDIQSDCIKVLYEVGALQPSLIAGYAGDFIALLTHKNNRLQWGAMTALDAIAGVKPKTVYAALPQIIDAADKGSVITKDHAVGILIKLYSTPSYAKDLFPLLADQLLSSPVNQLPMYAEQVLPVIRAEDKAAFINTLTGRLHEIEKESKRKRVERVIKKAGSK